MVVAIACFAGVAIADVLVLKDGTRLEGDVKRGDHGWTITTSDGKVSEFSTDAVKSIQVGATSQPKDVEADRLGSLRRSVENIPDINAIIDRYVRFTQTHQGTPIGKKAEQDLAIWKDRQARGLVKVADKWVTPQERVEMIGQAVTIADQARQFLKQNRITEAQPLIEQALAIDPQNATALYLSGLVLYQQNKVPQARQAFEAVNKAVPDHPPTLNNLAVILARQNAAMAAMNLYDGAMQAAPQSKPIIDNVAEALHALAEKDRQNPVAKRVQRRFTDQDAQLQIALGQQGLFRWGSTWVDQRTLDSLKAAEKEIKEKLDKMAGDFDAAKAKVEDLDTQIEETERTMRRMEASRYYRDGSGQLFTAPLPSSYYDLERDLTKLKSDRDAQLKKLDALREAATKIQAQLPVPRFSGTQQLIGPEGAPLVIPKDATQPSATTQPTTLPAAVPSH
ncbi:MAG TPA: tetratricopeptide repeat protein [Tepidisphaeraceae bacterium]|jgi:tetratricopeptide (TPR) repeat protein|nr:tetratricopeptide repeat protein [Tepidisphaeraceae bacterium]